MGTRDSFAIDVRYFHLSEPLQPYFTPLYLFSISGGPDLLIEDALHPEWATMRFTASGPPPVARIGAGPLEPTSRFVVSGPTSRAIRFGLRQSRLWGLGLQPAGFARYVRIEARSIADTTLDGSVHPGFAALAPLLEIITQAGVSPEAMAERIEAFLLAYEGPPVRQEVQILACQAALRDPEVASVDDLCLCTDLSRRSLERLCGRYFGFAPKLLLRRQRFLRSLAQFTVSHGASWSRALDGQYCDQAHFVRDFKAFMGVTPTEYAAAPHPIIDRIIVQRMADQGALPRTELPTLLRYGKIA